MGQPWNEDEPYVPPAWEAEDSPVPGIARGEYERMVEKILWFRSLTMEQKLASFEEDLELQEWFDSLRVVPLKGEPESLPTRWTPPR